MHDAEHGADRAPARSLVVLGGGALARQVPSLVDDINDANHFYQIVGFLAPQPVSNLSVLGDDSRLGDLDAEYVIAIADPETRHRLDRHATDLGRAPAVLRHPSTTVESRVDLQPGCLIMPGVRIQVDAKLGRHVFANANTVIGHDTTISDHVSIGPLCTLCGGVTVGTRAFIGAGAVVLPGVVIGADAIVGAGSVVTTDIAPGQVVAGVPVREIRGQRQANGRQR